MPSHTTNFDVARPKSSRAGSDASSSISTDSFTTRRAVSTDSPRPSKRKSSNSQTVNVYTHCGRHSSQFLFGGRSFSDMARHIFKRD
ncbi:hypothetical protein CH63R_02916 [Colletotrichum higginsianum IMI 349063]|uniref:Uncharacterized protein n=3 Tax=Colletotrichum higginsianum TaxID=80884 RepID=A0A1B7YQ70_COLHI|nr:hypothetical protein CH63R_02916 [Colletotrichum higginsianum IMI 349063]OBR14190.1 hypothetical protein CH63R_02916 [Colletotrichum higginsianum IMI 349063]TID02309.1 hypothetical protein CH35J_004334 [Colletotrichum higginsianum]